MPPSLTLPPMRVVFLDFDGVLNARVGHEPYPLAGPLPHGVDPRDAGDIDPAAVHLLDDLVARARAKIVISSTWRNRLTLHELRALLRYRGLAGEVIGATPTLWRDAEGRRLVRGDEIAAWLAEAERVEAFVILDDDDDMAALSAALVRTRGEVGLTTEDVERAVAHLTRGD